MVVVVQVVAVQRGDHLRFPALLALTLDLPPPMAPLSRPNTEASRDCISRAASSPGLRNSGTAADATRAIVTALHERR